MADTVKSLGPYQIESVLGEGAMGVVYKAHDPNIKRTVAIKTLREELLENDRDRILARFKIEAQSAGRLVHLKIVTVYGFGEEQGMPYIVMEYALGKTLKDYLDNHVRYGLEEIVNILLQLLDALDYAHSHKIVHRDIKPANIILDDGKIKVTDFGIAKIDTSSLTVFGDLMGTPNYMSPEQWNGEPVDHRTDIFSAGVILYQLLIGEKPFSGDSQMTVRHRTLNIDPSPPSTLNPRAPAVFDAIVQKAIAKNPRDRFQSVMEFLKALRQAYDKLASESEEALVKCSKHDDTVTEERGSERDALAAALKIALLYKHDAQPDEYLLKWLEMKLCAHGYRVFIDRHLAIGVEWAKEIERQVQGADAVIPLLSEISIQSEMLAWEVQTAYESAQNQNGKPRLLPVRVNFTGRLPEELANVLDPVEYFLWESPKDNSRLLDALLYALRDPPAAGPTIPRSRLEAEGGAVPLDSKFYIVRSTDEEFYKAIARQDSIVLVKGARQMGKTSVLARGLQQARKAGIKVVLTDFQKLDAAHLQSPDALYQALGEMMADQLGLDVYPEEVWNTRRGANANFERYLRREVLGKLEGPLVWGMDEVDRLFACSFCSEIFGLFRSWHNGRALDPSGLWSQLTLAIVYATEAYLFIRDLNQSPFNVGTRLTLQDFSFEQVKELNRRYGSPLRSEAEVTRFFRLVGGQPYLVRRGLHEMVERHLEIVALEQQVDREEGPFGDHLRRILVVLAQHPELCEGVRHVLRHQPPDPQSFYRLRSAGVLQGGTMRDAHPRCQIYASYLERHLL